MTLYRTEMNTLNQRAAWRAWLLTKLNLPVKIIGGAAPPPRPLHMLRHWMVLALINVSFYREFFQLLLDNCLSVWLILLYVQEDNVLFCYWILLFLLSYIQCSGTLPKTTQAFETVESSSVFNEKQKDDEGTWQRSLVRA